jgi:hypothetical protein
MKNIKNKVYNKYLKYIIIILLFIVFILIMKYFYLKHYFKNFLNTRETFEQENNCKGNAFCAYDLNKDACVCASQKDDARLQFPNNPNCCNIQCNALPKEKCVTPQDLNIKYYCNISGKCKEYNATMKDSVIMANICGIDNVTNQYIMPFASKEECERSSDVCNKYNDKNLSAAIVEKNCLNDTNCGMCYNESGVGKCVMGSPAGPNDLDKYYFCKPSERKSTGSNAREAGGIFKYGKEFTGL